MYTIPEYRGKGLAKRMLKKCIDESRNSGVKRIWLHASKWKTSIQKNVLYDEG
ncbi:MULTISPECIES: GNAT family N-acetyltransferase [unclassified Peribacillus]|uniref:GNAT family N-acetyltransferase n=1 Tax=unclassified Peribacillus TaxID=2675266 RepID=UPI001F5BDDDC|nr:MULTISPECIES: GNAT family N-acetyltransferase [unclassified Peribacillus]WMX58269.1 GNAT family N-acetyltransferase [Peribacillus sp. R9-11]